VQVSQEQTGQIQELKLRQQQVSASICGVFIERSMTNIVFNVCVAVGGGE
jgi:hypothetical protein